MQITTKREQKVADLPCTSCYMLFCDNEQSARRCRMRRKRQTTEIFEMLQEQREMILQIEKTVTAMGSMIASGSPSSSGGSRTESLNGSRGSSERSDELSRGLPMSFTNRAMTPVTPSTGSTPPLPSPLVGRSQVRKKRKRSTPRSFVADPASSSFTLSAPSNSGDSAGRESSNPNSSWNCSNPTSSNPNSSSEGQGMRLPRGRSSKRVKTERSTENGMVSHERLAEVSDRKGSKQSPQKGSVKNDSQENLQSGLKLNSSAGSSEEMLQFDGVQFPELKLFDNSGDDS